MIVLGVAVAFSVVVGTGLRLVVFGLGLKIKIKKRTIHNAKYANPLERRASGGV